MQTLTPENLGNCGNCGAKVTTGDDLIVSIRGFWRNYFHAEFVGCQRALEAEELIARWNYKPRALWC